MNDEKIRDTMVDFILDQEKVLIETKFTKEKKKQQKDLVNLVLKKLKEQVDNENKGN